MSLFGNVVWLPTEFLRDNLPFLSEAKVLEKKADAIVMDTRAKYLSHLTSTLKVSVQQYQFKVSGWMVGMESAVKAKVKDDIRRHAHLFIEVD